MNTHKQSFAEMGIREDVGGRGNTHQLYRALTNHRWVKVSAFSLMCLSALPSLAQPINCSGGYWLGGMWICPQQIPGPPSGSSNPNGPGHDPGDNNSGGGCWIGDPGCHSDSDGEDLSEPETCSAYEEAQLRHQKSQIPNCHGDPGQTFNVNQWLSDNYWNINSAFVNIASWFNQNIWGLTYVGDHNHWLNFFNAELHWLARQLERNNNDIIAVERQFQENLWRRCHQEYATWNWQTHADLYSTSNQASSCYAASASLMHSYRPGTSFIIDVVNFFAGTEFSNEDNGENWGGLFNEAVNNHFSCHAVYKAWDEENCGGTL